MRRRVLDLLALIILVNAYKALVDACRLVGALHNLRAKREAMRAWNGRLEES